MQGLVHRSPPSNPDPFLRIPAVRWAARLDDCSGRWRRPSARVLTNYGCVAVRRRTRRLGLWCKKRSSRRSMTNWGQDSPFPPICDEAWEIESRQSLPRSTAVEPAAEVITYRASGDSSIFKVSVARDCCSLPLASHAFQPTFLQCIACSPASSSSASSSSLDLPDRAANRSPARCRRRMSEADRPSLMRSLILSTMNFEEAKRLTAKSAGDAALL
jgi:hypothetical protein